MKTSLLRYFISFILVLPVICMGQPNQTKSESFLQQAELYGLNGVSVAKFAHSKIKNSHLKKYAVAAHNDYVNLNQSLTALADKKKIELLNMKADSSSTIAVADETLNEPLDSDEAADEKGPLKLKHPLDRSFLKMMIDDFQIVISYYESSLNTDDADLKQYMESALPVFRKNMMEAIGFTQQVLAKE